MNVKLKSGLVADLRNLYQTDDVARRLLDNLANRQTDRRVTPASRAAVLADASHGEIVALLRKLDDIGAGEFKVGRRGSKTRIEWLYSQRGLGQAARGEAAQPEKIDEVDPDELEDSEADVETAGETSDEVGEDDGLIAHSFQLRPDLRLSIRLPADLTSKEAERLAGFIRQVPFGD